MKQKINIRLAIIAVIAIVATTIGITFVYYGLFRNQVHEDLKMAAELLNETGVFETADETNIDKQFNFSTGNFRVTWIAQDGSVIYDNDNSAFELENHLDRPEIKQAIENGTGESVRLSETMGMNTYNYAILQKNGTIVRISTEARTLGSVFIAAIPVILLVSALILGVCILLGHLLTNKIIEPINQMAEHLDDHSGETTAYKELEPFENKIRSQHDKILRAASIRQDFTANVSHELKTPLTAIKGYAELLENGMIPPENQNHIVKQIRKNADRLLKLINDIIELSDLDRNENNMEFAEFDLYELASECCRDLEINAAQKSISIDLKGEPTDIMGDKNLISELIYNLVQNSIQYNDFGGEIRVFAGKRNDKAVLEVKDNGIGIPKVHQERVFERFYRVDKSRSRETGGTGLGLAIVKHIAEVHNADLKLESEYGLGTTVTVTF